MGLEGATEVTVGASSPLVTHILSGATDLGGDCAAARADSPRMAARYCTARPGGPREDDWFNSGAVLRRDRARWGVGQGPIRAYRQGLRPRQLRPDLNRWRKTGSGAFDMKKVKAVARLSPDLDGPSLRPGRPGDRRGTAPKDGRIASGGGRAHELRRILNGRSSADTLAGIAPDSRIRLKRRRGKCQRRRGKCQGASPTTEQETSKQCDHLLSFSTQR